MKIERLLNLDGANLPEFLYRIVPIDRFIDGCTRGQNALVSPLKWEDPWEAAQLRTRIEYPLLQDAQGTVYFGMPSDQPRRVGGTFSTFHDTIERVFCQCWSDISESDAMWKLYSPDEYGVKMKVRSSSLFESLLCGVVSEAAFMGQVKYIPEQEMAALIADVKGNYSLQGSDFDLIPCDRWAKSLLRKRIPFVHESEYRLIVAVPLSEPKPSSSIFNYKFDFRTLVNEIELDPRCKNTEEFERRIRESGFSGAVTKSRLYEHPPLVARLMWPADEGWCTDAEREMKGSARKGHRVAMSEPEVPGHELWAWKRPRER